MRNHDDEKSIELFNRIFPHGFTGDDVFAALAPQGWAKSNLFHCFHPTVEQQFEEAVRLHNNLSSLRKRSNKAEDAPPTLEEIKKEYKPVPVEPQKELQEIIGYCLWDIFSDNHEVMDDKGIYEIGSFRGAAGFIADYLNQSRSGEKYDYMDFYMGSIWIRSRVDLSPVYRLIFQRLKNEGCYWRYYFPKLGMVDFSDIKEENMEDYSPEKNFLKEKENEEKKKQNEELQNEFDEINKKEKMNLKSNPPKTIQAYLEVFGQYPLGWVE